MKISRRLCSTIILAAIGLAAAGAASATDTSAAVQMCNNHAFCDAKKVGGHIIMTVDNQENGVSVIDCPAAGGECHVMHHIAKPNSGLPGATTGTLAPSGAAAPAVKAPSVRSTTLGKPLAAKH